jgi:hypothetical protein
MARGALVGPGATVDLTDLAELAVRRRLTEGSG